MKLILLYFSIKTSLVKIFEYLFDMPAVCEHVVQVDKYIVER